MADSSAAEWRRNLQGKADEVRRSIMECIQSLHSSDTATGQFRPACGRLSDHVSAMELMYAVPQRPPLLAEIKANAHAWPNRLSDVNLITSMVEALTRVVDVGNGNASTTTLEMLILEKAKDQELADDLAALCTELRRILNEGQDEIASSMEKELRSILEEIEKLKGKSLVELDPWLEFLVTSICAASGEFVPHGALLSIAGNALCLALKSRTRIKTLVVEAREKFVQDRKLRFRSRLPLTEHQIDALKKILTQADAMKYLTDSPPQLKTLPQPPESDQLQAG